MSGLQKISQIERLPFHLSLLFCLLHGRHLPRALLPVSNRRLYQVAPRRRAHAELALAGEVAREVAVGTLKTRYPRVQVPGQDKRRGMQIIRSRVSITSA
jgi:hypothetical protein